MNRHRAFVAVRWLAGVGVGVWTWRHALAAGRATVPVAGALNALFALAGLLVTVLLVAPDVVGWVLTPVNRLIDNILLPNDSGPPPVDYTLAHFYRRQMRYEEACDEYMKIIRYHPRELRAYVEGMLTAGEGGQTGLAARFHRLGRSAFRNVEVRRRLQLALDDSLLAAEARAEAAAGGEENFEELPLGEGEEAGSEEPPVEPPER